MDTLNLLDNLKVILDLTKDITQILFEVIDELILILDPSNSFIIEHLELLISIVIKYSTVVELINNQLRVSDMSVVHNIWVKQLKLHKV